MAVREEKAASPQFPSLLTQRTACGRRIEGTQIRFQRFDVAKARRQTKLLDDERICASSARSERHAGRAVMERLVCQRRMGRHEKIGAAEHLRVTLPADRHLDIVALCRLQPCPSAVAFSWVGPDDDAMLLTGSGWQGRDEVVQQRLLCVRPQPDFTRLGKRLRCEDRGQCARSARAARRRGESVGASDDVVQPWIMGDDDPIRRNPESHQVVPRPHIHDADAVGHERGFSQCTARDEPFGIHSPEVEHRQTGDTLHACAHGEELLRRLRWNATGGARAADDAVSVRSREQAVKAIDRRPREPGLIERLAGNPALLEQGT
jgi:hypothetical protein